MSEPASRPLTEALRAVRIEEAERTGVVVALREAAESRLAILRDRLAPAFAEVPQGIDLFDIGLTPGETPRLWIDMIAFVEMGRDRRTYRFLQDTRNGRIVLAESEDPAEVAGRITRYMARRLIERDRLLALPPVTADEAAGAGSPRPRAVVSAPPAADPAPEPAAVPLQDSARPMVPPQQGAQDTPRTQVDAPGTGGPGVPPLPASRSRSGILAGIALFLIGLVAGAGGLLALAQVLARY